MKNIDFDSIPSSKEKYETGVGKEVKNWIALRESFNDAKHSANKTETIVSSIPHQVPYFWSVEMAKEISLPGLARLASGNFGEFGSFSLNSESSNEKSMEYFRNKVLHSLPTSVVLSKAIEPSHTRFLKLALSSGHDVDCPIASSGRTLLLTLAAHGDTKKLEVVLSFKPNMNYRDNLSQTALFLAIVNTPIAFKTLALVRMLLCHGADVNARNYMGSTALHRACMLGNLPIVEELLKAKADVFIEDEWGKLPIQSAGRYTDQVMILFQKYVDCCGRDRHEKMWAHIMSRQFVKAVFQEVEPSCPVCRRKYSDCAVLKTENFRYWLFVHDRDMS